MNVIKRLLFFVLCVFINFSCKTTKDSEPTNTKKINTFIRQTMEDVYLWESYLPVIDETAETDTKAYFKKLLYAEDKWSYITDNATMLTNSLSGIETTFGYQLSFFKTGSNEYFAVVNYVNPGTAASRAGIRRGDYFTRINGNKINADNYKLLVYEGTITLTKATLSSNNNISELDETVTITSAQQKIDPVLLSSIIEKSGVKIGYMVYNSYVGDFNYSLTAAFERFKAAGVNEFVLDLRYNGGGDDKASTFLCSSLVPENIMNAKELLVVNKWNDKYQTYWKQKNYTKYIERRFEPVSCNLNLKRIFILTSNNSASASELTIIGLKPYMNVIQIGQTTYGKYTSMILVQPNDKEIDNWALLPIVSKYENAKEYTDFKNGLIPDYEVNDELFPAVQLGDESEALLAKAIELITGKTSRTANNKAVSVRFQSVESRNSIFDELKNNDIIKVEFPDFEKP